MNTLRWLSFALLLGAPLQSFAEDAPASESQVLEKLHEANQMEIDAGVMAASRAQTDKVKQYGEKLIKDHRQADETVLAFAKRKAVDLSSTPAEPKPPEDAQQQAQQQADKDVKMARLRTLSGADFDREFLTTMVDDHSEAIQMVRNARSQTRDPEFRALLNKLLPVLQQHHDLAQKLQHTMSQSSAS